MLRPAHRRRWSSGRPTDRAEHRLSKEGVAPVLGPARPLLHVLAARCRRFVLAIGTQTEAENGPAELPSRGHHSLESHSPMRRSGKHSLRAISAPKRPQRHVPSRPSRNALHAHCPADPYIDVNWDSERHVTLGPSQYLNAADRCNELPHPRCDFC